MIVMGNANDVNECSATFHLASAKLLFPGTDEYEPEKQHWKNWLIYRTRKPSLPKKNDFVKNSLEIKICSKNFVHFDGFYVHNKRFRRIGINFLLPERILKSSLYCVNIELDSIKHTLS